MNCLQEDGHPGPQKPTGAEDDKATIKNNGKLIMISSKEED